MRPQFSHALARRLLVRKANKQENLEICVFSGILSKDLCALDIICEAGCLSAWLVVILCVEMAQAHDQWSRESGLKSIYVLQLGVKISLIFAEEVIKNRRRQHVMPLMILA
jgi:hypothetical protein